LLQLRFVTSETAPSFPAQGFALGQRHAGAVFADGGVVDEMDDGAINLTTITGCKEKSQVLRTSPFNTMTRLDEMLLVTLGHRE
jgi:hypothetical protein